MVMYLCFQSHDMCFDMMYLIMALYNVLIRTFKLLYGILLSCQNFAVIVVLHAS